MLGPYESFSEHWNRIRETGPRRWLREAWTRYVTPDLEREDPRFRRTLDHLSVVGLRVVAGFCLGGPALWLSLSFFFVRDVLFGFAFLAILSVALLGLVALGLSFWRPARRYARLLALAILALLPALDLMGSVDVPVTPDERWAFLVVSIMLMKMLAIGALPLRPLQMAAFSALLLSFFVAAVTRSGGDLMGGGVPAIALLFLVVTSLTSVGLTMVVYYQRRAAYLARQSARRAFEELRDAQVRVNVSENAASQSHFAAALSHELNTPLGALVSAFDTLIHAHEREREHPDQKDSLEVVWRDAGRSGRASASRLRETIDLMKRLTNLDRAEVQVADVNLLWRDTAALLAGTYERTATVELALGSIPPCRCRPQQVGAVFSNLLRNAAAAVDDARGRGRVHIRVSTERRGDDIVMEVTDDGRGMSEAQVRELFEPKFHIEGERVSTTNWGLFVSRSIVTEHGGTLVIESEEGVGTTARVVLPSTSRGTSAVRVGVEAVLADPDWK